MAVVLLLVFLPILAAVGFMFGSIGGQVSAGSLLGAVTFLALATFILVSFIKMARPWDGHEE